MTNLEGFAADRADGIPGVTVTGAGGFQGALELTHVAQRLLHVAGVVVVTVLASVLRVAIARAGGSYHGGLAVMACGVYKGILIAVATNGAGVGGIAHVGAVWLCDNGMILVFRFGDGLGVAFAAVTGEGHDALFRAGGFLGDSLGVGVSQGIGVVAHIAVSAALVGTGIGGVTHFVVGGCLHLFAVAVSQGGENGVDIAVIAVLPDAGVNGVAGLCTGGAHTCFFIAVPQGGSKVFPVVVAALGAGVLGIAIRGTGRRYGGFGEVVTGGFNDSGFLVVTVPALTDFYAVFQASDGLRYSPFAHGVTSGGNDGASGNPLIAIGAVGVTGVSVFRTGGVLGVADLGVLVLAVAMNLNKV